MLAVAHILQDVVVVLAVSTAAVYVLRNVRMPSIVGFLFAGLLIGPHGLALIAEQESVELLAEVGVIFLLFTIGLRFSVGELLRLRSLVFGAGALQMIGTTALTAVLAWAFGTPVRQAIFLGVLVGLSSTAIVLRLLEARGEVIAPHGRLMVSILIFQDIAVVPLMLCVPLLAGTGESWTDALSTVGVSLGLLALILVVAHFVFPWLLERVVRSRSRELFTLATILGALGTAWLCGLAGVSLPLGAFIAGVVLSESVYAQQILSEVLPLRDLFASLFFVSIGMLVDPGAWGAAPVETLSLLIAVVLGKAVIVAVIALVFGFGRRIAVLAGLGLAQIGEFSFIIAEAGRPYGLLSAGFEQSFLTVAVLSMALSPLTARLAQGLVSRPERLGWLARYLRRGRPPTQPMSKEAEDQLSEHVIIVGFGINGRYVARVLRKLDVPYHVLELNPHTVRMRLAAGDRILYGDATQASVLRFAGVEQARALVITIPDPPAARRIVAVARRANPKLHIMVRTRFVAEVDTLHGLGADDVIPEELETSLELAGRVMADYDIPPAEILREKRAIREEHYESLLEAPDTGDTLRADGDDA